MQESSEMLKKILEERGIEWDKLYSSALQRLVNTFDEEIAGVMFQRAYENAEHAVAKAKEAENNVRECGRTLVYYRDNLNEAIERAAKVIEMASEKIQNPKESSALILYKSLLQAGKDVFGEERMSDSAIASICQSASYIVYHNETETNNGTPFGKGSKQRI